MKTSDLYWAVVRDVAVGPFLTIEQAKLSLTARDHLDGCVIAKAVETSGTVVTRLTTWAPVEAV